MRIRPRTALIVVIASIVVVVSTITATYYFERRPASPSNGPNYGAPLAPPFALTNASNSSAGGVFFDNYSIGYTWGGPTFGQVGLEVKTGECEPVPAVTGIEVLGPAREVIAWERNSSQWAVGAGISVVDGDTLSFSASAMLIGDEWVMSWTEMGENGSSGGQIGDYLTSYDGCDFTPFYPQDSNFDGP